MNRGALARRCAETWIGTPFIWHGRVRAGCDCKGLFAGVFAELGFPEAEHFAVLAGDYGWKVPVLRLRAGLDELFDRVPLAERAEGDLLLCKVGGAAQHLAMDAPRPGYADRVIEAQIDAMAVRPFRRPARAIAGVWRLRELG